MLNHPNSSTGPPFQRLGLELGLVQTTELDLALVGLGTRQRWNRVSRLRVIGSPGQRFWPGLVRSRVSVSDPVFDPVLSFNKRIYHGVVSTE